MAFGIGLVAALIALKRSYSDTRLKTLQKRLKEKSLSKIKLYQYPLKKIISIILIILFAVSLEWFAAEVQKDMKDQLFRTHLLPDVELEPEISNIYLISNEIDPNSTQTAKTIEVHSQLAVKIVKLRSVIWYIDLFLLVAVISLILSLDLKVVTALRGHKSFKTVTYSCLGIKSYESEYKVQEGDKIGIWQLGEDRFTNTNYYFSVRIVNEGKSCNVIRKSCMFDARTSAIKLADQLEIPYSTKVNKIKGKIHFDEDDQQLNR